MLSRDRVQDAVSPPQPPFAEYFDALLERPPFDTSPRRAGLLRYLVEKSLASQAESLNEYAIALEVFGKPESFDQRIDSSVRSEISRLRKMVALYYDGPGARDPWRIVFPPRGYVPQVQPADEPPTQSAPNSNLVEQSAPPFPWAWIAAGAVVLATVILGVVGWEHWEARKLATAERIGVHAAAHTPTPEAQALFLKGQYYWAHRTEGHLRQAVDAYTQAIVADSNDAAAYAGLAECYDLMPIYTPVAQAESFTRAIAAANKALALDPENAVAHRALGFALYWSQADIPRAFMEFQEAIRLSPNDADGHHWYATALNSTQRRAEGKREIDRAQQLAPASRAILADQAMLQYMAGDQQAAAKLHELEVAEPDFISPPKFLARIDLNHKNYRGYLDQMSRMAALSKDPQQQRILAAAKIGYASGGVPGMLQAMKAVEEDAYAKGQTDGYELAHTCALLGDKQDAVRYLQGAFGARDMYVLDALDPDWAPAMHGYPPFELLLNRIRARFAIA